MASTRMTGQLKFQMETGGPIQTPLGFSKKLVFAADMHARMYCIQQATGHVLWTFSSGSPILQQPRVVGEQVFVVPNREGLAAISISSGQQQWQQPRANELVAASETRVYASDLSKNLLILDRQNGKILGAIALPQLSVRVHNDRTDRIYLAWTGRQLWDSERRDRTIRSTI